MSNSIKRATKKKAPVSLLAPQKVIYTLIGPKQAAAYIWMLLENNYAFTCLPYSDCVRIETYINAPKPQQVWLAI